MVFEIYPYIGLGSVHFGDSVDQVRNKLSGAFSSFKRSKDMVMPCDYFSEVGIFVYYKLPGKAEAIESSRDSVIKFGELDIFNATFEELLRFFQEKDPNLEVESDTIISFEFGVSIYFPDAENNVKSSPESVLVFEKGYYD